MTPKSLFPDTVKRLYILDYGLFQVAENGRIIGIPGYLIQTDDRNILVDTGFPAWYAENPERASLEDGLGSFGRILRLTGENLPESQLARIGLTSEDVNLLVITHTDIDHVGGIGGFPGAKLILGREERAMERPRYFEDRSPIPWPEGVGYQLVERDMELVPGMRLIATPGHSPGHLSILLALEQEGKILLTCDAVSRPAEMEEGVDNAWDPIQSQVSAKRLMTIAAAEGAMVIYGHDPAQWQSLRKAPEYYC
ncbi:MAG: N-acyl homoserine lactonase family protein [Gemmatimonadota bacterium]|nr:N-acyl homoserine lactonase family protein [Gemmatimonadota bacterium]